MCGTCGCSEPEALPVRLRGHEQGRTVRLEEAVLGRNDALAARNRAWFAERRILALNLVSSPGSGKTTLLERTIRDRKGARPLAVIEGDQETSRDADRIRAAGAPVVQINTGTACHLDAHLVEHALERLRPEDGSVVVIENVGNLICPSMFDLGEGLRVLVASVTEGEDKPLKYPHMFRSAGLVLLNKIDLLPYVPFDVDRFRTHVREVNPRAGLLPISAVRGDGLDAWFDVLSK